MRLAEGFSQNAQILLLDEPTNHLDERSTAFLIRQVQNYRGQSSWYHMIAIFR